MAKPELKKCPFCGADATLITREEGDCHPDEVHTIECNVCPAEIYDWVMTKDQIINAWNQRVQ